jgi:thymidylate synthase
MKQYLELVNDVLLHGDPIQTRNGTRITTHGRQMRFNLRKGFPAVTTKKLFWKGVVAELCWFLNGGTNVAYLQEQGVHIWDANADRFGNVGPIYGYQWRQFNGDVSCDQIFNLLRGIKMSRYSTRHMVNAWNPQQIWDMQLPPCHFGFQVHISPGSRLSLQASMRSTDVMVGLPFNIASYALLTHMICAITGHLPHELIMDLGNVHIYEPHVENAKIQLGRKPKAPPQLIIRGPLPRDLKYIDPSLFHLEGYSSHPSLKYKMFV